MRASRAALVVVPVLALGGCGTSAPKPPPAACFGQPATIAAALRRAPAAVTLADGTPLSTCIARARADADLQDLSVSLTQVADELRARAPADPVAALRLGYLAGAVRRGASVTTGLAVQLALRIEGEAVLDRAASASARAALAHGLRSGRGGG